MDILLYLREPSWYFTRTQYRILFEFQYSGGRVLPNADIEMRCQVSKKKGQCDHYLYDSSGMHFSDMLDECTAVLTDSHSQMTSQFPSPQCPFLPYILN